MRIPIVLILVALTTGLSAGRGADDRPATLPATVGGNAHAFGYADVYVDSGPIALAAYQVEITADDAAAQIVSIEGGEHTAFNAAPYYDARAVQHNRIILAAFSTGDALPHGRTRVARIHVFDPDHSPADLHYSIRLMAAGDANARSIAAQASIQPGGAQP